MPAGRASTDNGEQGFGLGEATGDASELRSVSERLEVERRCADVWVVGPGSQEVVPRDIGLVAQGDQAPDPEAQFPGQVRQHDADPARLGGHGQAPAGGTMPVNVAFRRMSGWLLITPSSSVRRSGCSGLGRGRPGRVA